MLFGAPPPLAEDTVREEQHIRRLHAMSVARATVIEKTLHSRLTLTNAAMNSAARGLFQLINSKP